MSRFEHNWSVIEEYPGIYVLILTALAYGDPEMRIPITKEQYDYLKQW